MTGADVSLLWSLDENGVRSRSTRHTVTDAGGYFLFTQLGSGQHVVNISAAGFGTARLDHDVSMNGETLVIRLEKISLQSRQ